MHFGEGRGEEEAVEDDDAAERVLFRQQTASGQGMTLIGVGQRQFKCPFRHQHHIGHVKQIARQLHVGSPWPAPPPAASRSAWRIVLSARPR